VAILIVFAILLTRGSETAGHSIVSSSWVGGLAIAIIVFGVLSGMVLSSKALALKVSALPPTTVREIGDQLMSKYILPLEVVGLLLTAALIGAVLIAMQETKTK